MRLKCRRKKKRNVTGPSKEKKPRTGTLQSTPMGPKATNRETLETARGRKRGIKNKKKEKKKINGYCTERRTQRSSKTGVLGGGRGLLLNEIK